jgi:SAM-dependent methyltransferase
MYGALAPWWPLLSAPADYAEEAESFLRILDLPADGRRRTLLELGSGGGNLASHLRAHFDMTLSDLSAGMLDVSRSLNPDLAHVQGDMRTLRLGRTFDVVLIHDAVMYCTTAADVRAALETAVVHGARGGTVLVAPDCVRETFVPETSTGGEDGAEGRALRYMDWTYDADPADSVFETVYAIVTRDPSGEVTVALDRHAQGLFSEAEWRGFFAEAGLSVRVVRDAWNRHIFVGVRLRAAPELTGNQR